MATATKRRPDAILLNAADNVCIVSRNVAPGASLDIGGGSVTLGQAIPMGHKVARANIPKGAPIVRYGQTIGYATESINPGDWVHVHNVETGALKQDYEFATAIPPDPAPIAGRTFQGYRRADGRAATRNYLCIVSSVNCSASVSKYVAAKFDRGRLAQFANVDGILPITHKGGCGMQFGGDDHRQLALVLAGFAKHANVGAFLLIGLGCETATLPFLVEEHNLVEIGGTNTARRNPPILTLQDCGGTQKTIDKACEHIDQMLPALNDVRRETLPASEIILGLNCGGSDGSSGVTANPALGVCSDRIVAAGGTTVLAETPEIFGAEHLLTRRARSRAVGEKIIERVHWWEGYAAMFGAELDNNPSAGNKDGGLTTIYEKSLGAVAKGGSTALNEVYRYAEPIRPHDGFVFMDTPGFDPPSVTGLVAGGANVVCFTTGRGSCYGCKPTPSIKIASNTPMYERMKDDMDLNAGVIYDGVPVEEVGSQIFDLVLAVASGQKTKSEQLGVGDEEFAPWSIGPTL